MSVACTASTRYVGDRGVMRIAALYDIHGNLPALEAALADVDAAGVDHIVVGGDVFPGPMALEALAMLRSLETPVSFIRGNCERDLLACRTGAENAELPESVRTQLRWTASRLGDDNAEFIANWPLTTLLEVEQIGTVLFCHATPRDDNEIFTLRTPLEQLAPAFEGVSADVVVCGHTHVPFDRRIGTLRVLNAGSVGMTFTAPGAYWLLLGPDVSFRRTVYNVERAAERIQRSDYPDAKGFAAKYVL